MTWLGNLGLTDALAHNIQDRFAMAMVGLHHLKPMKCFNVSKESALLCP